MSGFQKFLFDTSFEPQDMADRAAAISVEVHAQALQEEYIKGLVQGKKEAQEGIDARNTEQLHLLNFKLVDVLEEQRHYREKVQTLLAGILQKSLEKLFPVLAQKEGIQEVMTLVSRTFKETPPGREIVVFAHPDTVDSLQEKLQSLSREVGESTPLSDSSHSQKQGVVIFKVQGDDSLNFSDCRLTWEGGGLERLSSRLYQEIKTCLERLSVTNHLDMPKADNPENVENVENSEKDEALEHTHSQASLETEPRLEKPQLASQKQGLKKIDAQTIKETQDE